jgi:hypothetical protein
VILNHFAMTGPRVSAIRFSSANARIRLLDAPFGLFYGAQESAKGVVSLLDQQSRGEHSKCRNTI